jgi:hypothetical protein
MQGAVVGQLHEVFLHRISITLKREKIQSTKRKNSGHPQMMNLSQRKSMRKLLSVYW